MESKFRKVPLLLISVIFIYLHCEKSTEQEMDFSGETWSVGILSGGTLVGVCFGEACESCKGPLCRELSPEAIEAIVNPGNRIAELWNVAPNNGVVEPIVSARGKYGSPYPLVGLYTLESTHLMSNTEPLPPGGSEEWYLHCEREGTPCTGASVETRPECRCHPLFDLSLQGGINFNMEKRVIPNPGSVNPVEPMDLTKRQNWLSSKYAETFKKEPFDHASLDMLIYNWPYSIYQDGKQYLAEPVELNYSGRVSKAKDYLKVLRAHLPEGAMVFANGGQADYSLSRFLPSIEFNNPLPTELETMIQSGNIDTVALGEYFFSAPRAPTHPEWWDQVGVHLDGIAADGWMAFPLPVSQTQYLSKRWSDEVWKDQITFALKGINADKFVFLMSDGGEMMDESGDLLTRQYSIGNFLLLRSRKTGYLYISIGWVMQLLFITDFVPTILFIPEADIPLGKPLAPVPDSADGLLIPEGDWEEFAISGGTVYGRRFEHGAVLVNPSSTATVSISVPESLQNRVSFRGLGYLSVDGEVREIEGHPRLICTNPVVEVTLAPTTAGIFLDKGIPPSEDYKECPESW